MFSSSELQEIRNSVDIVDVVSSYINLTAHGKNYFGVCPFHDDHSPSMCVSREKQIYTCFVCGATGNVFQFIKEYENISFTDAVRKVAQIGGIDVKIDDIIYGKGVAKSKKDAEQEAAKDALMRSVSK